MERKWKRIESAPGRGLTPHPLNPALRHLSVATFVPLNLITCQCSLDGHDVASSHNSKSSSKNPLVDKPTGPEDGDESEDDESDEEEAGVDEDGEDDEERRVPAEVNELYERVAR